MVQQRLLCLLAVAVINFGQYSFSLALAEDNTDALPLKSGLTKEGLLEEKNLNQNEVLRKIHLLNLIEMRAGNLASYRGNSQFVRDYGKMLVKDHALADSKVQETARSEDVDLAAVVPFVDEKLNEKERDLMNRLEMIDRASFDRTFLESMRVDHLEAIVFLKDAENKLKGTGTAQLIADLLPALKKHAQRAAVKVNHKIDRSKGPTR